MTTVTVGDPFAGVIYPESDGEPIAENTRQFQWIVKIQGGLDTQLVDDPQVLVVGDLFWYPVQGQPNIRTAPDVMVVFGRPKGHRRSYQQWNEGNIPPQVVFEVLSPSNRAQAMQDKFAFYQQHGVEEYYIYDPDHPELFGWQRSGTQLLPIPNMQGWVSPRLNIRFDMSSGDLILYHPDGRPFATFLEVVAQRTQAEEAAEVAEEAARLAEEAARLAEEAAREAQAALEKAQADATKAQDEAAAASKEKREADDRAEKLAAQLRALGIEPNA